MVSIPLVTGVNAFAGDPAFAGVIPVASISTFTSLSVVEGTLPVAIQYTVAVPVAIVSLLLPAIFLSLASSLLLMIYSSL